jgi:hypothetical protein
MKTRFKIEGGYLVDNQEIIAVQDLQCLEIFMWALHELFTIIRSKPNFKCNISLLNIYNKYVDSLEYIDNAKLKEIEAEIIGIEQDAVKQEYKETITSLIASFSADSCNQEIQKNINKKKMTSFEPLLKTIIEELQVLIKWQLYDQVSDLADTFHNYPEFLINSKWKSKDYWKIYIMPYRKKWNMHFLEEWKRAFIKPLFRCMK